MAFTSTPGFSDGWFNGDPKQMIAAGTYDKFRDRMPGLKYSAEQIAAFDSLNEEAKKLLLAKKKLAEEKAAAVAKEKAKVTK